MVESFKGGCLCGAVTYQVQGPFNGFHLCHCNRCRKATGSVHASNLFTEPENLTWLSGEEHVRRFDLPTAKRFARNFCEICGSALPYVNRPGTAVVVPAGSLDDDPHYTPDDHIFWLERVPWYDQITDAPHFDTYP
ncbi:MAG: aldehyde-activating protein [marine bacterium B5-7]|nr:MAG: aldehyde-activating protein [marine bacterium B5-7]